MGLSRGLQFTRVEVRGTRVEENGWLSMKKLRSGIPDDSLSKNPWLQERAESPAQDVQGI